MNNTTQDRSVVIMVGMYRSGTSLTASLLQDSGVFIGDRLMAANSANPQGYFEDLDFVEFHQNVLQSQGLSSAGWTTDSIVEVRSEYISTAKDLISAREKHKIWGWKDPRTTLFLDFWSELIPDAKYVFVFRSPWQVVDSLFRRGDVAFRTNPNLAIEQWCNYNRAIIDFYRRYKEKCFLLEIDTAIDRPNLSIELINQKWGWNLRSPKLVYKPSLWNQYSQNCYRQALIAQFFPQAIEIYQQLQQLEDGSIDRPAAPQAFDLKTVILQDWSDLQRARLNERQLKIANMDISKLQSLVAAMESSKFWQLRQSWFAFKAKLNMTSSDAIYQNYLSATERDTEEIEVKSTGREIAPLDKYIQRLKRNVPFKQTLKKIARTVADLSYPSVIDIRKPAQSKNSKYQKWLDRHYPKSGDLSKLRTATLTLDYQPSISIIVPIYNPQENFLRQAIESVLEQAYPNWELCLADDCSTQPYVKEVLEEYARQDERIKVVQAEANGHICRTSNAALEIATGEYIALLDHDDLLAPHALAKVVELLNEHPEADFIYSDEDKVDEKNLHQDPFFKPDWCPDSFLSRMYTCHLGVYRRSLVNRVGNFRIGFEGSQDYDLVLRVTEQSDRIYHIPDVLYHWRIHPASTASESTAKPYAADAAQKAIAEAIARRGEPGEVKPHSSLAGVYTVRYEIKEPKLVSIIIPTKDLADTLDVCLRSIFTKTTYPNYEVIVIDNGSTQNKTKDCFEYWGQKQPQRFKCYRYDVPFNFSQINNYAVTQAQGDYLLFLNNDTEVVTPDWLEAMVEQAQRPTIGAVGSLLLYPDDTIQHAGVVLGIGDIAGHSHKYFHASQPGYISQIASTNNYSAVTGACLMCRREVFEEVNGFEEELAVAFNDIDLCLKFVSHGYRNIYLPHVVLYHYESKSRGYENTPAKKVRFAQETDYLKQKWQGICDRDPCYNPNLTRTHEDYSLNV